MGRKKRSANNNVKRERFAVKELARLKKCLGIVDEKSDGTQILNKVADITTVTDAKAIKKKQDEQKLQTVIDEEMAEEEEEKRPTGGKKKLKSLPVVNEKTGVTHIYDAATKKDQFGNYPVWYNRQAEKKKKRSRLKKGSRGTRKHLSLFTVSNIGDYK